MLNSLVWAILIGIANTLTDWRLYTACAFAYVFLFYLRVFRERGIGNFPPGPLPIPVFGNLLNLNTDTHLCFTELSKKYGDIFTVYMGGRRAVVLNSFEVVKDAFSRRDYAFAGKNHSHMTTMLKRGKYGSKTEYLTEEQ